MSRRSCGDHWERAACLNVCALCDGEGRRSGRKMREGQWGRGST